MAEPIAPAGIVGLWRALRRPIDPAQRATIDHILDERARLSGPATPNFIVLSLLSSAIAAMGLLLDSAPAVIGAMLLGPFITPLLAIAGSLVQGWGRRLWRAALMVAVGVCLSTTAAFAAGTLFSARLEAEVLPTQLLTLTRPGLLDLAIALFAGIAAGYATMRTEAAGALSGVAVSVTLEPPLAAMGLFLATGDRDAFNHSALAFATNFGALVLGATASMAWWGFADRTTRGTRGRARIAVAVWLLLVAAVAVPLTLYSTAVLRNTAFAGDVGTAVHEWDPSVRITDIDATIDGDRADVTLELTGPQTPEPAWRLAELLSDQRGVTVSVRVIFTLAVEDRAIVTD